jgi:hypothetical protein
MSPMRKTFVREDNSSLEQSTKRHLRRLETLMVHSVEEFLTAPEINCLMSHLSEAPAHLNNFAAKGRADSIHEIRGRTREEAADIYEPFGRLEITELPPAVVVLLDEALERHADAIRRNFPSLRRRDSWVYVEYGVGQYIVPHVDFIQDQSDRERRKVAGVSLLLEQPEEGGEFLIYTCGADALWESGLEGPLIPERLSPENHQFLDLHKTSWVTRQQAGTAIFYGAQVIHGTAPVARGHARKIIGFLTN